jgi:hypothetical protein
MDFQVEIAEKEHEWARALREIFDHAWRGSMRLVYGMRPY